VQRAHHAGVEAEQQQQAHDAGAPVVHRVVQRVVLRALVPRGGVVKASQQRAEDAGVELQVDSRLELCGLLPRSQ
jgi:hypothetical protein